MEQYCIIHTKDFADAAEQIGQELAKRGARVCAVEAVKDQVEAAKEGANVSDEISACMKAATVCIFLVDEQCPSVISLAAQGIGEKKMVVVHADGATLPEVFTDLAEIKVSLSTPNLVDAICGKSVWLDEKGDPLKPRTLVRVKCQ